MTPAINLVKKSKLPYKVHEYTHDAASESYGEEAAQALGQDAQRVFKTLLVAIEGDQKKLAVGIVPVSGLLNLKAIAAALKVKKVVMAEAAAAERATGYVVGGISPLGQKKRLPTVIDQQAQNFDSIYVSAGKRGLEIELAAADLSQLTSAIFSPIARTET